MPQLYPAEPQCLVLLLKAASTKPRVMTVFPAILSDTMIAV